MERHIDLFLLFPFHCRFFSFCFGQRRGECVSRTKLEHVSLAKKTRPTCFASIHHSSIAAKCMF